MEAVPRLHMLWFALKSSPEGTSFANLKQYIAEFYQEDPESFSKEVYALETLRNQAMHPTKDGCNILKRYYCQLHSLQNRFPQLTERCLFTFTWKDLYQNNVHEITDIRYELAAILFNIGASHTQVGASVTRGDVDGMKLACTHFQCAAWAFGELREHYSNVISGGDFMNNELLVFMQQVCFAQAQECILEKSLIDNRKPNIVAKVTAQITVYYGAALAALLTGGEDGQVAQVIDSSVYKLWKKYVRFKISYLNCILYLYQGQHAEEQRKMGERVTLYQAAWDKLEEARKESKGLPDQKEINESLIFTADVVEAKRKNAKNENEFIYHEAVPELSSISAVQGANLVNGISFSVTDPDIVGEDIFARLVPMKAHEASSMYSEEKAKLLRKYGNLVEEKDNELTSFMSSLTLEHLNISEEKANKIPQGIVDRCAALNANKSAIPDLISAMSQLAEICADVEFNLKEINELLIEEEREELDFQRKTGVKRTINAHITELTREYQKYAEAHTRAGESNETLRKAMELHVNNLNVLAKPLQEIQISVPKLSTELNTADIFKDVKLIINKINEMKAQRAQFHADLRIAVNDDDITAKVIAHGSEESLQSLFDKELSKHERLTQLIDQNLLAQQNILQALTESYAKAAPVLKTLADVKNKRENFFSSLAASYDVYEDLLAKSAKGLEFYKKLSGNVHKLLSRLKSARDVQSEERQQRLKSVITQTNAARFDPNENNKSIAPNTSQPGVTPKLRDYLKNKKPNIAINPVSMISDIKGMQSTLNKNQQTQYLPSVRPNPLGSENPAQAACSGYYASPNEPPPPYSLQQQYYDSNMSGYTNPMYQPQQQNIAPPAYKQQASPNSTFNNLNMQMSQLNLQQQQNYQSFTQQKPITNIENFNQAVNSFDNPTDNNAQKYGGSQFPIPAVLPSNTTISNIPLINQQMYSPAQGSYDTRALSQNQGLLTTTKSEYNTLPIEGTSDPQQNYIQQSNINPTNFQQYPMGIPELTASKPLYVVTPNISNESQQITNSTQHHFDTMRPEYNLVPNTQYKNSMQGILPHSENSAMKQNPTDVGHMMPTNSTPDNAKHQYIPQSCSISNTQPVMDMFSSYGTTIKHPGYSFNSQTGQYEYGSGYQEASNFNANFYGQYTSAASIQKSVLKGTDSENANKMTVATGFDLPIVSHTKSRSENCLENRPDIERKANDIPVDYNYYTPPYGYQSNGIPIPQQMIQPQSSVQQNQGAVQQNHQQELTASTQKSIYIQSGSASVANTQTTSSGTQYSSCTEHNAVTSASNKPEAADSTAPSTIAIKPILSNNKINSNIDLLSDIDFSKTGLNVPAPLLPEPLLKPQILKPSAGSVIAVKENSAEPIPEKSGSDKGVTTSTDGGNPSSALPIQPTNLSQLLSRISPTGSPAAQKSVCDDNFSICSDLSSIDNFDWDSVSLVSNDKKQYESDNNHSTNNINTFLLRPCDPFNDDKTLKYFHKEVERFEKIIESINVKMLNGHTHLTAKWKELEDLLEKDKHMRTTTIAKLFPEKNRSLDCLPYDHARVKLEKNTDDYINAAFVKNLGTGCPNFIIGQTPQQNTINDFWSMIWSQKARTIACLHTPNEMLDPYWPQSIDGECHFDDFLIKCIGITQYTHCVKYHLKLSMHGADPILDLSIFQIKSWSKSNYPQLLAIAENVLETHQKVCLEFQSPSSPLVLNCLTGSERSELLAIAICAIVATQIKRPVLINVVDIWFRICSQRQNSLRNVNVLDQSMQIVLNNAHNVINKRGILTSYQMQMAQQHACRNKEEIKDPLNELDPLWKLK